jgi:Uma2 family endonuclease
MRVSEAKTGVKPMATTTNLLSWEAFEQLPDDGMHYEILAGELIISPRPKSGHNNVATNAFLLLTKLMAQGLGRVYAEAGYKLSENPATWIQPDVSFLTSERVRETAPSGYFLGAPELAVEIDSPSESAPDLEHKVDALLAAGGLMVWMIYPAMRKVRVFLKDGTSFSRGIHEKLSLPELLSGWEIPVSQLFED